MSSEWQTSTIGELCTKVYSGGTPNSRIPEYYGGSIPWLRTKEVNYGKIYGTEERITQLGFENSSAKLVPINSVIVAMYGNGDTAGRVAINKVALTTNQACCNLVVDPERADYRFVYYFLSSRYQELVDLKNGGAQQNLNGQLVKAFPISIPALGTQQSIADALEVLDDRITLLRETNATLEAIAQALFKSWFVDFAPVRAKMEGRAPEGMDEATAALFPDGFEASESGLVPRGWPASTMDEVSTVGIGKTPPRKEAQWFSESADNIRWVSIRDMGASGAFASQTSEYLTEEAVQRFNVRRVPDNTVLLSFKMTIGRVAITDGEMTTNEAIAHFKLDQRSPLASEFIYLHLKQFDYAVLSSTSSIADAVNSKTVKNIPLLVPDANVLRTFQDQVEPLFKRIKVIEKQAQTLATLRDTLLPRLISGALRLPAAEAQIEEVTA